jgi:hypothetical protein
MVDQFVLGELITGVLRSFRDDLLPPRLVTVKAAGRQALDANATRAWQPYAGQRRDQAG